MEQDIRKLFEAEIETDKKLPASHREEFQQKLEAAKKELSSKQGFKHLFKYAAAILTFLAFGYLTYNKINEQPIIKESALELQLKEVEQKYLKEIETEWHNFKAITEDEKLVERYKKALEDLNADYKIISEQFKTDHNNILIIESLVNNLQTRLQLLKDIQAHIKLLNQENALYETIQI
ncbi:MAG: hypothetical protein R2785_02620 [Flavobacteriaceae bacterium]